MDKQITMEALFEMRMSAEEARDWDMAKLCDAAVSGDADAMAGCVVAAEDAFATMGADWCGVPVWVV